MGLILTIIVISVILVLIADVFIASPAPPPILYVPAKRVRRRGVGCMPLIALLLTLLGILVVLQ